MLTRDPHPLLDASVLDVLFSRPLGELAVQHPQPTSALLGALPVVTDDDRSAVRRLLKLGGFKPTGRNKPSSESLAAALERDAIPTINLAVDAGNMVSRLSGLPISVVDADRVSLPARLAIAGPQSSFVFNASQQVIDVEGLISLMDAEGPCANAVKDSQRTKTHAGTRRVWVVVWGTRELPGRTAWAEGALSAMLSPHGTLTRL